MIIKQKILNKIDEIALAIQDFKTENISLMGDGLCAKLLFLSYYYELKPSEIVKQQISGTIDTIIEIVQEKESFISFCNGLSGLAWCFEHLSKRNQWSIGQSFFSELDDVIFEFSINEIKKGNYDFLHGGIGSLQYFLNKKKTIKNTKKVNHILDNIISSREVVNETMCRWKDYLNSEILKEPVYNLGLAHGIPSIIFLIAKSISKGYHKTNSSSLIYSGINYVEQFQFNPFPYWVFEKNNSEVSSKSRLAWCYGDLTIGYSIYKIGKIMDSPKYHQKGIDIINKTFNRRDEQSSGVCDASLCHGSFGLAYIYFKLYKETNSRVYKEVFNFWFNDGFKQLDVREGGVAGYGYWDDNSKSFLPRFGILEGICGIGLILLSIYSDEIYPWDECILLS